MSDMAPDSISNGRRRAMLRTAMGPTIASALADPLVVEVMVNPDGALRLDRLGEGRTETGVRYDPAQVERADRSACWGADRLGRTAAARRGRG
jgi:Flp pilus assembly CpaF family ATPase